MLILTRRIGETIIINDNIKVTVMSTNGFAVSLGIEAPRDVIVDRKEVWESKQAAVSESSEEDDEDERAMRALARIEREGRISYTKLSKGKIIK